MEKSAHTHTHIPDWLAHRHGEHTTSADMLGFIRAVLQQQLKPDCGIWKEAGKQVQAAEIWDPTNTSS